MPLAQPISKKVRALKLYEGARRKLACRYLIGDRIVAVGDYDES
jgi:hypothetical protein